MQNLVHLPIMPMMDLVDHMSWQVCMAIPYLLCNLKLQFHPNSAEYDKLSHFLFCSKGLSAVPIYVYPRRAGKP
jgi:hypothetical protein